MLKPICHFTTNSVMLPKARHGTREKKYSGSMKKRNQSSAEFKTKFVIKALREEGTVNKIAVKHEICTTFRGRSLLPPEFCK